MAGQQKKHTCFGLFFKGFLITGLILANLAAVGLMVGIKFYGLDYATWTDFTHTFSKPMYIVYAIIGISAVMGVGLSFIGAAVSAMFGGGKKGTKSKPQSKRRSTV